MKKIFTFFIILAIAVFIGIFIHKDAGYVLIVYSHWTIETSLWIALTVLIIFFICLYIVIRLLHHTSNLSTTLKNWSAQKRLQKAMQLTNLGLCELTEGHWEKAEKYLVKAAEKNHNELINYLAASHAAQEQNKFQERDLYLKKAHEAVKGSTIAVGLTQAQLQIRSKQWEQALATLKHLNEQTTHHEFILKLLQQVYIELEEWENLKALLPQLEKCKTLSDKKFEEIEKKVFLELLTQSKHSASALEKIWQELPRYLQQDLMLIKTYTAYLLAENKVSIALPIIEKTLKRNWDTDLVKLYSEKSSSDLQTQIKTALDWEKFHPNEPELLFTLARLYAHDQNWMQAKTYLDNSLHSSETVDAYELLGFVEEQLKHSEAALACYKKALDYRRDKSRLIPA